MGLLFLLVKFLLPIVALLLVGLYLFRFFLRSPKVANLADELTEEHIAKEREQLQDKFPENR